MRMLQSILVASDLCPESTSVVQAAAEIARVFGSRVTLLHVVEPLPSWPIALYEETEQAASSLRALAGEATLREVPVAASLVAVGPIASTIVRKAQEIDADLIVIGAGRQSEFGAFRPGTVAEAVLEHAAQPVLAIRSGTTPSLFQNILCPVDHSPASARGLRNAIRLTRAFGTDLHVVSIIPHAGWFGAAVETGTVTNPRAEHERRWKEESERFIEGMDFQNVRWTREIRRGDPATEIISAAHEQQADVIVMGSTGRSGLVRMLMGSVARRVLRQLPCSLLTVKDEDTLEQRFDEDVRQVNLLMAEGDALRKEGCYLPALVKYRQVTAIDPFHVGAIEARAEIHERLGQHDEAEAHRRRVERIRHREIVPV